MVNWVRVGYGKLYAKEAESQSHSVHKSARGEEKNGTFLYENRSWRCSPRVSHKLRVQLIYKLKEFKIFLILIALLNGG